MGKKAPVTTCDPPAENVPPGQSHLLPLTIPLVAAMRRQPQRGCVILAEQCQQRSEWYSRQQELVGTEPLKLRDLYYRALPGRNPPTNGAPIVTDYWHVARQLAVALQTECPDQPPAPTSLRETSFQFGILAAWCEVHAQREWAMQPPPLVAQTDCILYVNDRCYRINDKDVTVTEREDCVLQAFIGQGCMDKPTLQRRSGVDKASEVLRGLVTKFGGVLSTAIHCPGGRGRGGYRVSIIRSQTTGPNGT